MCCVSVVDDEVIRILGGLWLRPWLNFSCFMLLCGVFIRPGVSGVYVFCSYVGEKKGCKYSPDS